jgi:hypothetical protein
MCLPVIPPHPREREGERNKHFGLREREVFRVRQHCRRVTETFRVVSFSPPAILAAGSWRKGDTRGRPERPPLRSSRDRAPALCRLQTAACFSQKCSVLDAARRWPGAVREGAGQSGCVRRRQQIFSVCEGNFSSLSRAREIKTICKLSENFNFYLFL